MMFEDPLEVPEQVDIDHICCNKQLCHTHGALVVENYYQRWQTSKAKTMLASPAQNQPSVSLALYLDRLSR